MKTLFLRRKSDNLYLVVKENRCKNITDLITPLAIKSEASKLHSFEISLVNTLKKLILTNSNRNYSELTIAALPHLTLLKDSTTSNKVDDQAEFTHVIRIILELEY